MFDEEGRWIGTYLAWHQDAEGRINRGTRQKKKKDPLIASVWMLGGG